MKPEHYFGPKFHELLSDHDLSKPYYKAGLNLYGCHTLDHRFFLASIEYPTILYEEECIQNITCLHHHV